MRRIAVLIIGGLLLGSGALASESRDVLIQGRILCLDENGEATGCTDSSRDFALETADGELFFFSRSDQKTKMFWDSRVRERELRVKVWVHENNRVEIIKVYSLVGGELFDIHYFCAVCNITAYGGGPCWCCQDDFELRETPVN